MNKATLLYVRQHADEDVRMLALRGSKLPEVDLTLALQQIQGRQTARHKLPTWAAADGILYPPHINMEQCSSELTARYKASVCRSLIATLQQLSDGQASPTLLVDLTGGFGVDCTMMARAFDEAVCVEQDEQLCAIASDNFKLLCEKPVRTVCADGMDFFPTISHATVFFLDPARRDDNGGRTYGIADCTPNVLPVMSRLLERSDFVVLKLSPMLDWRKAVADLGEAYVREVHIVAAGGECKELLIVLSVPFRAGTGPAPTLVGNGASHFPLICAALNEHSDPLCVSFHPTWSANDTPQHYATPSPGHFVYEPNAAVMKAGCFDELAMTLGVEPLSANSHLFVSDRHLAQFPGRCFRLQAFCTLNKRELKATIGHLRQANITTRNFPLTVAQLRQRLKLADGGDDYLLATTLANGQHVLLLARKA